MAARTARSPSGYTSPRRPSRTTCPRSSPSSRWRAGPSRPRTSCAGRRPRAPSPRADPRPARGPPRIATGSGVVHPETVTVDAWLLAYEGFDADGEGVREALCTLGNGYFATRGAAAEAQADGVHYPGTYLSGGYDRLVSEVEGGSVENEDLVNLPNWLPFTIRVADGEWLAPDHVERLDHQQRLDMRAGVLTRIQRFRDAEGRTTQVLEHRLVSM